MGDTNGLTSIELFTGAGGLAMGVAMAGFKHLAVIEWDHDACESLRENKRSVPIMSDWPINETDVREWNFRTFRGRVDLLAGGPPCQPFSLGGKHRGMKDERNMFPEVYRALNECQPQAFVLENVKGLHRSTFRWGFDYLLLMLSFPSCKQRPNEEYFEHAARLKSLNDERARGKHSRELTYQVTYQLVNCADFGIPQRRERVFIIGFRSDLNLVWKPLQLTHTENALFTSQWVTRSYWREHRKSAPTPPLEVAERLRRDGAPLAFPQEQRWLTVRDALRGLPKPKDRKESAVILNHVGVPGARTYAGHTGSALDLPAKTIKAGDHGVPGGENIVRHEDGSVRYLTVREAARLQTFPDEYRFCGSWGECMRQLGNAVPVSMAARFATEIRDMLKRNAVENEQKTTALARA